MPLQPPGFVDLKPVLDAIAEVKADVAQLGSRMDRLEERMAGFEGELKQQGMLMRAMAKVILPEDAMVDDASDSDAAEKLKQRRASQLRGSIASPR